MFKVLLPRLDPDMRSGNIVEWLKKEGDVVTKGETIAKIEGEKVIFNVDAPESGIIGKILIPEGKSVPIATTIAIISQPGEKIPEIEQELSHPFKIIESPPEEKINYRKRVSKRIRATPLARKIAKDKKLDIMKIQGTGLDGRIEKKDVLRFLELTNKTSESTQIPKTRETILLAGMRKTIAERMTQSYKSIPQLAISMEINMSEMLLARQKIEEKNRITIPLTALLTKITAYALEKYPIINSTMEKDQIKIYENINIGVAVAVEEGLIVPIIHDANNKSLNEIASLLKNLVERTRKREITADELKGGTFTITNLGGYDVKHFIPIINPPQAAILGVGSILDKPIVIEKEIKIVPSMMITLVFDHRILDGAKAAKFLKEVKENLEKPNKLPHDFSG